MKTGTDKCVTSVSPIVTWNVCCYVLTICHVYYGKKLILNLNLNFELMAKVHNHFVLYISVIKPWRHTVGLRLVLIVTMATPTRKLWTNHKSCYNNNIRDSTDNETYNQFIHVSCRNHTPTSYSNDVGDKNCFWETTNLLCSPMGV